MFLNMQEHYQDDYQKKIALLEARLSQTENRTAAESKKA